MRNYKIYKPREQWAEYEKKYNKASYRTVCERYIGDMVLCNDIPKVLSELGEYLEEEMVCGSLYDEENDQYVDIYQYFICNLNGCTEEDLQELEKNNNDNSILLAYSEKLGVYILMVDHWGTGWDYVMTDIELTDNLDEIF